LAANLIPVTQTAVTWTHDFQYNPVFTSTPASDSAVIWADQPQHDQATTEITAYVRHRYNGVVDGNGGMFCQKIANVAPYDTFIIQANSPGGPPSGIFVGIAVNNVRTNTAVTAAMPTQTQYLNYFARWRSGEPSRLDVLDDRGAVAMTAVVSGTSPTGTLTYVAGQGVRLGIDESSVNVGGDYSQALVWKRRLGDSEIQALAADPFGWYSPRRETIALGGVLPLVVPPSDVNVQPNQPLRKAGHL
jgi:hypothetical protein